MTPGYSTRKYRELKQAAESGSARAKRALQAEKDKKAEKLRLWYAQRKARAEAGDPIATAQIAASREKQRAYEARKRAEHRAERERSDPNYQPWQRQATGDARQTRLEDQQPPSKHSTMDDLPAPVEDAGVGVGTKPRQEITMKREDDVHAEIIDLTEDDILVKAEADAHEQADILTPARVDRQAGHRHDKHTPSCSHSRGEEDEESLRLQMRKLEWQRRAATLEEAKVDLELKMRKLKKAQA